MGQADRFGQVLKRKNQEYRHVSRTDLTCRTALLEIKIVSRIFKINTRIYFILIVYKLPKADTNHYIITEAVITIISAVALFICFNLSHRLSQYNTSSRMLT